MFRSISTAPPPPKLVRSINKVCGNEDYNGPQAVRRPLVWSTPENPEYMSMFQTSPTIPEPLTAPLVPAGILPNSSYPVYPHITLRELCQELQYAFSEVDIIWTRQGNQFRWDIRTKDNKKMETGIDIQIFSNEDNDRLCVHFQVHFGDNWYAHEMIDQISRKISVDMSECIHLWKRVDEQLGYLS